MKKVYISLVVMVISVLTYAQNSIDNPFFEHVDYNGAFGTVDWTAGWANFDPQNTSYPATTVTVPAGDITTNTTWTSNNTYLLNGFVYVKDGATLTIEAGTVIRGDKANKGTLIIERGGRLIAQGTMNQPIVFTSNQTAGSRYYGDWGGVILLGKSVINPPGGESIIEGGVGSSYGGGLNPDINDNSGVLRYVRIEFPGIAFEPNNEINGLTMGGVGAGTTLDYVQVSYSGDDSYEWFGGTVNARHLIAYRGLDDDFDTDFGFEGMIQFGVAQRDPAIADEAGSSNGFESDNDATGTANQPYTKPIFSNMSMFGPLATPSTPVNPAFGIGMHIRRNSRCSVYNSIFAGYKTGLKLDGDATQAAATAGELNINNVSFGGCKKNYSADFDSTYFVTESKKNHNYPSNDDLKLTDPFDLTHPDFLPMPNSPVLTGSYWGGNIGFDEIQNASSIGITCYPNPVNGSATIDLTLKRKSNVRVALYNITGARVATILNKEMVDHEQVIFDTHGLPAGLYFMKVTTDNDFNSVKIVIQ